MVESMVLHLENLRVYIMVGSMAVALVLSTAGLSDYCLVVMMDNLKVSSSVESLDHSKERKMVVEKAKLMAVLMDCQMAAWKE